jgi:N-acetylmuramoyl-L-alanine amidase
MARDPGAQWKPLAVNYTPGGCHPRLVVLHITVGSLSSADSWFRNTESQVSAHFGIPKTGQRRQWVDTGDIAWHAMNANGYAIGVENEGQPGDHLTASQITQAGAVCAWAHTTHGIPLQVCDTVTGHGLAWHGLGGAAWGGHTACPGTAIVNQRAAVLKAAQAVIPGGWYWHAVHGYFTVAGIHRDHSSAPVTIGGHNYYWHAHPADGTPHLTLDGQQVVPASGPATW